YFFLLDLGLRGSIGRTMALYKTRSDQLGVNRAFNTAAALLAAIGLAALVATGLIELFFLELFAVPAGQVAAARLAVMIVGGTLAVFFPLNIFDAALWSSERFDLLNRVDIGMLLLRTLVSMAVVAAGYGIVALAIVVMTLALLEVSCKGLLALRTDRGLRFGRNYVAISAAHELYRFGIWCFLASNVRNLAPQIASLVIGAKLAVGLVTPYAVVVRLVAYVNAILAAATGVLTPVTTALHATQRQADLRRIFLEGGLVCSTLATLLMGGLALLGKPFITFWMGRELEGVSTTLLVVIAAGEALPMAQLTTYSILLGMERHRLWAWMTLLEVVLGVAGALALNERYGLVGVAVAFAVPAGLCRGLCQFAYASRVLEMPVSRYLLQVALPVTAAAVAPLTCLSAALWCKAPATWWELLAYATLYTLLYAASCLVTPGYVGLRRKLMLSIRSRSPLSRPLSDLSAQPTAEYGTAD
ncbi:MAG: lipopolysaccharide biosynthesis protein, partial [Candidatus Saccharimonadales bacterium]